MPFDATLARRTSEAVPRPPSRDDVPGWPARIDRRDLPVRNAALAKQEEELDFKRCVYAALLRLGHGRAAIASADGAVRQDRPAAETLLAEPAAAQVCANLKRSHLVAAVATHAQHQAMSWDVAKDLDGESVQHAAY
jgi:hypothetical protein